jgi:hypothetical protein
MDVWCTGKGPLFPLALLSWQGGRKLLKLINLYWTLGLDCYYYYYRHHRRHYQRAWLVAVIFFV